jgi:nitric oxide dioxygenase
MTFEQVRLVRTTYQSIADMSPVAIGRLFYTHLFEIAPEVQPLFSRTSMNEQSVKLMTMLTYVVSRLDRLDSLIGDLSALARRHERYGVAAAHYALVGQALLYTLSQGLGTAWTPEVKAAWTACYTLLADTMIAATAPAYTTPIQ